MKEVIFSEYERIRYNYDVCLLGFKAICRYCKDIEKPSKDIMVIGDIIEKTLDGLKDAPTEVNSDGK